MAEKTGIQWTDKTWNPWYGCSKVSPGCAHCYMFREAKQYGRDPEAVTRSKTKFADPLKWERDLVRNARGAQIEPVRVFTCSWSDWFHEDADEWRSEAWDIVRRTPHLTYQILTKRPERIASCLPADWGSGYPNVWLGVSVEYDRWLSRARLLNAIPAAVRFLSCEPLLGDLDDLTTVLTDFSTGCVEPEEDGTDETLIHWLILGGESGGREARPVDLNWLANAIEACEAAGTAVFVKQLGSVWARENRAKDWHGGDWSEWPDWLRVREFPTARTRELIPA
jgi:protein gp37